MSALPAILIEQLARLAINNRAAAMALLPASFRSVVTALEGVPQLRQRLDAQWAQLNNAIEADWGTLTAQQRATIEARLRQKRQHLDAAQSALNTIDAAFSSAAGILRSMGLPVPGWPIMPRGLDGLGALPAVAVGSAIVILAAGIGGAALLAAYGLVARELAAAERISTGAEPPPPPLASGLASIGTAGLVIAGVMVFALMRGGRR